MIPRKIHYCWFGKRPLGKRELKCIKSWSSMCPNYEIILCDETNAPIRENNYVQEAFYMRKWAFVSDYVRLKVLSEYGGIYLDTDVELLKSLDDFRMQPGFLGFESRENIATCVIGCVKGHPFLGSIAKQYDSRFFCTSDGSCDETTNTIWLTKILVSQGLKQNGLLQNISNITIYPPDVFCPLDLQTGRLCLTERSSAIHYFAGSWMTTRQKIHTKIAQFLGVDNTQKMKRLLRRNK